MLFGKDYINYANFGNIGTPIYVTGRYTKGYNNELRFKISDIKLLSDIKGRLVNSVTITLDKSDVNDGLINALMEHVNESTTDRGTLNFRLFDGEANRTILMTSDIRIPLNRKLASMLDEMEIEYKFN